MYERKESVMPWRAIGEGAGGSAGFTAAGASSSGCSRRICWKCLSCCPCCSDQMLKVSIELVPDTDHGAQTLASLAALAPACLKHVAHGTGFCRAGRWQAGVDTALQEATRDVDARDMQLEQKAWAAGASPKNPSPLTGVSLL